jgi:hypothetical protein
MNAQKEGMLPPPIALSLASGTPCIINFQEVNAPQCDNKSFPPIFRMYPIQKNICLCKFLFSLKLNVIVPLPFPHLLADFFSKSLLSLRW